MPRKGKDDYVSANSQVLLTRKPHQLLAFVVIFAYISAALHNFS